MRGLSMLLLLYSCCNGCLSELSFVCVQMLLRQLSQSPDGKGRMFLHMLHRLELITAQTQPTTWSLMVGGWVGG